jgi:glycerol-3-phosphate dehydrogenase
MKSEPVDVFVIGGGINGAAIARDAAGRGLSVMLAEKGDYAGGTSSASSNLIHGGLRYLENFEFGLVRQSLRERETLLKAAPYLVEPLRFLVPLTREQQRPAWKVRAGLLIYDILSGRKSIAASGRLAKSQVQALPRLRKENLENVFHYTDCRTDDARLALALIIDARERGANVANYCTVISVRSLEHGYRVKFEKDGNSREIHARFVVNATGPWANNVNALCDAPPDPRNLRLVKGSHIVLPMPVPACGSAYALQNDDGRVVFTLPWQQERFLVIGTTDVPYDQDPSRARCSDDERHYLLQVYNRYFEHPGGAARTSDIKWTWSGVRPLVDDGSGDPSEITRDSTIAHRRQGNGGFITVYGGKLTTHRDLAEKVLKRLGSMGLQVGRNWTESAILPGGHRSRDELLESAKEGPGDIAGKTRLRWASTYGDRILALYERISKGPQSIREIAPGVLEAELLFSRETEDAITAEDFLHRRTKLVLTLSATGQDAIRRWFGR